MHPPNRAGSVVALALVAVVVVACGAVGSGSTAGTGGPSPAPSTVGGKLPFVPRIISSESIVGPNRFLDATPSAKR